MKRRAIVSVPGKLILMGEHAVVYGRPAVVAAVAPRAKIEVLAAERDVSIDLPSFRQRIQTSWSDIRAYTDRARTSWQRYVELPTQNRFRELRSDSPAHLVKLSLGEAAVELPTVSLPPLEIRIESMLPIGSGFGSSAATAVGVVAAVLVFLDQPFDWQRVEDIAMEVERRQHGLPSGVDHKTVLYGGVVSAERGESGSLEVTPLVSTAGMLAELEIFHTGEPRETTGEVVAAVKGLREDDPAIFDRRLDRMAATARRYRDLLLAPQADRSEACHLMREYQRYLEEMGVVPPAIRETIREVESQGGAAKISGAGALSGTDAGCLLVLPPESVSPELGGRLVAYRKLELELGVTGLQVETVE